MSDARDAGRADVLAAWLREQGVPGFVRERGRRAAPLRHPATFGWTWLALTVVVAGVVASWPAPSLLARFWFDVPVLVVLLALAWAIVAARLVPVAKFSLRWFVRVLLHSDSNLMHVLPLLLVAVMFFFLTTETWQSIGALKGTPFFLSVLLLVVIALVFILRRGQSDTEDIGRFADADVLCGVLPAELAAHDAGRDIDTAAVPELRLGERVNVLALAVIGRVVAAAFVSLAIAVFFVVLGAVTVTDALARTWTGSRPDVWWSATLGGHAYAVTVSHVRVAVFLGVFAGLYFVVSSASDRELARTLSADTDAHLRTCFAVRAVYLAALRAPVQSNSDNCSAVPVEEEAEEADEARASGGGRREPRGG